MRAFVDRNREVNPILNAVIAERFDAAIQEAEMVDAILDAGETDQRYTQEKAPFLGVPFTAKEAFAMIGMPNSAGLWDRRDLISNTDADAVQRLREAGAIPIGLTNCSELCMWWESSNVVYGRTNNAYDQTRIVGGSSGGEGCILSAAGSVVGIGSDVGGSIRMPAFFNGIFGHKPTSGIVSNGGQFPQATDKMVHFLVTGPMCRYAADLVPMLKVMAGPSGLSRLQLDSKVDLKSLTIYTMEDDGGCPVVSPVHPEIKAAQKRVADYFENEIGCTVKRVNLKLMKYSLQIWSAMMASSDSPSFAQELSGYMLPEERRPVSCTLELFKWLMCSSSHTLPAIGLGLMENLALVDEKAIAMCASLKNELSDMLGNNGVLLYPPHPLPAVYHNQPLFVMYNFAYTAIFNVLGVPVTQCPLGVGGEGLPIGVQVVGAQHNDHLTLAVAAEIERGFGGWVQPGTSGH
ncbi:PREDICTED: fatty-acid amide hydrolase 2-like [Priapulus caudatus]|uniref:Fatty-acid amide hydrolase 2-like n=1 Tax=Priapulus caudatus TaxID=37621 RepID=A0ABM1FAU1_PRICU|nr:PREDICTED: fatty-acid amide hydrolase 2-like [Priapulus caudatus]